LHQIGDRLLPELWSFLKIANDLAAEQPQVVDVFLDGRFLQSGLGKMKKEWREALHQFLAGRKILIVASSPIQLDGHSGRSQR